jgi:hypothetical protein
MHFDVRFSYSGNHYVVLNEYIDRWSREQRQLQNFPFVHHQPFEIIIRAESRSFRVMVNQNHYVEFALNSRITLNSVDHLYIQGELSLNSVEIR